MILTDGINTVQVSAIELHKRLGDLEIEHHIASGGMLVPTAGFLRAVARHARKLGLSISLTGAWQLWRAIFLHVDRLRKQHAIDADIAHWFGVMPFDLEESEKLGLYANLERVQAQSILNAGNYSPTDYEGVRNLTLLATGSKAQADAARSIALQRFVESEIKKKGQSHV